MLTIFMAARQNKLNPRVHIKNAIKFYAWILVIVSFTVFGVFTKKSFCK